MSAVCFYAIMLFDYKHFGIYNYYNRRLSSLEIIAMKVK